MPSPLTVFLSLPLNHQPLSSLHHGATSPCRETNTQTNKWFESHHNNGQFYYSFSHYTVHAATSCMGEIKNNRLLVIILFPLWRKKLEKTTKNIWRRKSESVFFVQYIVFFFVDVVVFTRFSQIHSVNW